MSDTARLSPSFKISVPKSVSDARQWNAGQDFAFIPKGTGFLLILVPTREELFGIAEGANTEGARERKRA